MVLARKLVQRTGLQVPVLVDGMDDQFGNAYSAWPLRYFVVNSDGALLYVAEPDPYTQLFEPDDLLCWLEEHV